MKQYFALFALPKPTYEHAKIVDVIREASKGDFKQFPVPGGIAYAFSATLRPWEISFSKILLNTDEPFSHLRVVFLRPNRAGDLNLHP